MDSLSTARRSANMSRIRSKDTKPELLIRRMLHGLGYRYSLHRRDLPGVPDLVFPSRKKVILVHGCFWHQHKGCSDGRLPKSHKEYWLPKCCEMSSVTAATSRSCGGINGVSSCYGNARLRTLIQCANVLCVS